MRGIRMSGSEGWEVELNRPSLPLTKHRCVIHRFGVQQLAAALNHPGRFNQEIPNTIWEGRRFIVAVLLLNDIAPNRVILRPLKQHGLWHKSDCLPVDCAHNNANKYGYSIKSTCSGYLSPGPTSRPRYGIT